MAEEESEKEEPEENLLTERDVQIAALDIPERIQLVKGDCDAMM